MLGDIFSCMGFDSFKRVVLGLRMCRGEMVCRVGCVGVCSAARLALCAVYACRRLSAAIFREGRHGRHSLLDVARARARRGAVVSYNFGSRAALATDLVRASSQRRAKSPPTRAATPVGSRCRQATGARPASTMSDQPISHLTARLGRASVRRRRRAPAGNAAPASKRLAK